MDPVDRDFMDNIEPATGQVYGQIPDSNKKDVDQAVSAAKAAFGSWSKTSLRERSDILLVSLSFQNYDSVCLN